MYNMSVPVCVLVVGTSEYLTTIKVNVIDGGIDWMHPHDNTTSVLEVQSPFDYQCLSTNISCKVHMCDA